MAKPTFPKLSERVFAVRAAWRRQVPLRVRVEAVREAAARNGSPVRVIRGGPEVGTGEALPAGPPVRQVRLDANPESRVA